jgi:hypothetical protein
VRDGKGVVGAVFEAVCGTYTETILSGVAGRCWPELHSEILPACDGYSFESHRQDLDLDLGGKWSRELRDRAAIGSVCRASWSRYAATATIKARMRINAPMARLVMVKESCMGSPIVEDALCLGGLRGFLTWAERCMSFMMSGEAREGWPELLCSGR